MAVQPFAFVTVTVYVPLDVGLIHCVVCPLDQLYELPALEQSCPGEEVHDESAPVTFGVKFGKIVIDFDALAVQLLAAVTVTV